MRGSVEPGTQIYSDEHGGNQRMDDYEHAIANHLAQYVDGNVHTNGFENFWRLLMRTLHGTYGCAEPFHLFRYIDEQAFRFNNRRHMNDADRFTYAMRKIVGKRLTYSELTGNGGRNGRYGSCTFLGCHFGPKKKRNDYACAGWLLLPGDAA